MVPRSLLSLASVCFQPPLPHSPHTHLISSIYMTFIQRRHGLLAPYKTSLGSLWSNTHHFTLVGALLVYHASNMSSIKILWGAMCLGWDCSNNLEEKKESWMWWEREELKRWGSLKKYHWITKMMGMIYLLFLIFSDFFPNSYELI